MSVKRVPSHAEFTQIIQDHARVAVFFSASWCGVCGKMRPVFEEYAAKFTDVHCVEVDDEENPDSVARAGVQSFPTFKFYKDGLLSILGDVQADSGQLHEKMELLSEP